MSRIPDLADPDLALLSRHVLAIAVLLMVISNLVTWQNAEWQGAANIVCSREGFPAVHGPAGLIVTSHRTDCDTIAKESMTFVYLHPQSDHDASSNLILRYDGETPRPLWTDPVHLLIHADSVSYEDVDKLVAIRNGIHITTDFIDRSGGSTPPARPD